MCLPGSKSTSASLTRYSKRSTQATSSCRRPTCRAVGVPRGTMLSSENPEGQPPSAHTRAPALVVVDANVFAHNNWMSSLLKAARARHIVLLWSPRIIAEASRVLLWIRLERHGGPMTLALKRETFDAARRWF